MTAKLETSKRPSFGRKLALFVGIGLVGGAALVAFTGGGAAITTILALLGASSLSGWLRSRPPG